MVAFCIRSFCFRLPRRRLAEKKLPLVQPCAPDAAYALAFDATQVACDMQQAAAPIWVEETEPEGDGRGAVCRSLAQDFSRAKVSEEGQVQNTSNLNAVEVIFYYCMHVCTYPVPGTCSSQVLLYLVLGISLTVCLTNNMPVPSCTPFPR